MINKKAQVSIEVTIILAILVIGAVFLGIYYFSSANRYKEEAGRLDDNLNKLEEQGEFGEEENIPATCSDGIQNQGEVGVDCGGPCPSCFTITPPSQFNNLTLTAPTPTNIISQPFKIEVAANMGGVKVSKLVVTKDGRPTSYCEPTVGTRTSLGTYEDLGIIPSTSPYLIEINIKDCDLVGNFLFTVTGEYQGHIITDTETITITPNTFNSVLLSSSSSNYYTNNPFNINVETNIGTVPITNFAVKEEINGSLLPTPNCTVNGNTSPNGEFSNVGETDSSGDLSLNVSCNHEGKYSFIATGEYLGLIKTSNRLVITINDQPPPPVLALSIDPTPKMYEYFLYNPDYIANDCPNVEFDLNLTSNYKEGTEITEIEIKKKQGASFVLTNDCFGEILILVSIGSFGINLDPMISEYNLILPEISCRAKGEYQIRYSGKKDGVVSWSSPVNIYISDAFAYSSGLVRSPGEEFTIFIYSYETILENSSYGIKNLSIQKETSPNYYESTEECYSDQGTSSGSGFYEELGSTSEVKDFYSFENSVICNSPGNYKFVYYIEDPFSTKRYLEPLYIEVKE